MKPKRSYMCSECGYESVKWYGKCPTCGEWNTMVEQRVSAVSDGSRSPRSAAQVKKIDEVEVNTDIRTTSGLNELDRVLGGGFVDGSAVLVGGDPGIGKSTLLLQVCANVSRGDTVLYVSGEESSSQIKMRFSRLAESAGNLFVLCETNLENILDAIERHQPRMVIIDSIQTMYDSSVQSSAGNVSQVRECTMKIMQLAKSCGITVIFVGHVTKDGTIAGPRVLEHIVDCVLYFEGDRHLSYRILRSVKNRFGSTNEIGVFEMTQRGLVEVDNPSMFLLEGRPTDVSGTCIACVLEGSRPIMAEVQALVSKSAFAVPRRMCTGFDYNRAAMLVAVLEKRCGLAFYNQDAYVNVIGGLRLEEPAADLAVALSLASSITDKSLDGGFIAMGEIGLAGEIRAVSSVELRISEAIRLGFDKIMIPRQNKLPSAFAIPENVSLYRAKNIIEAVSLL